MDKIARWVTYILMGIVILAFIIDYAINMGQEESKMGRKSVLVFYCMVGTLLTFTSIHFLCEMQRNYGSREFRLPRRMVSVHLPCSQ